MSRDWFIDELDPDDEYFDHFQPEKADSRLVALLLEWFWDKVGHIIYDENLHSLYFDHENKLVVITEWSRYDMYSETKYETFKIPYSIFFSDSNIGNWVKKDKEEKKEAFRLKQEREREEAEEADKKKRLKRYRELQREFGDL